MDIYKIPAVQIIIEFLYKKQLTYFKITKVPMQVLLFSSFLAMIRIVEAIIDYISRDTLPDIGQCKWINNERPYGLIMAMSISTIAFIVANLYQLRITFGKFQSLGWNRM